jgi:hypothetical protein
LIIYASQAVAVVVVLQLVTLTAVAAAVLADLEREPVFPSVQVLQ